MNLHSVTYFSVSILNRNFKQKTSRKGKGQMTKKTNIVTLNFKIVINRLLYTVHVFRIEVCTCSVSIMTLSVTPQWQVGQLATSTTRATPTVLQRSLISTKRARLSSLRTGEFLREKRYALAAFCCLFIVLFRLMAHS